MLIVIDVGNTSIKFGFVKNANIFSSFTLPSEVNIHTADSLGLQLSAMLARLSCKLEEVEAFCISSVVPAFDQLFIDMAHTYFQADVYIVGKNINVPLENCYENPHEVGADRLMAAYAARMLYPNEANIISVDFGTATTFDCVENNAYLGGLICPGVLSSHAALSQKAAKLPRIALEVEGESPQIGRNTATSISHGFVYGFVALTEGLLTRLSRQLTQKPFIIATGGFAPEIARHISLVDTVEPNLILIGLVHLYINKNT